MGFRAGLGAAEAQDCIGSLPGSRPKGRGGIQSGILRSGSSDFVVVPSGFRKDLDSVQRGKLLVGEFRQVNCSAIETSQTLILFGR